MAALDIITVEDAKNWLSTEDETALPRLIASAVNWVELYTGHKLYPRTETVYVTRIRDTVITGYPAIIVSVLDVLGEPVPYKVLSTPKGLTVEYGYTAHSITVNAGYQTPGEIPPLLVEAAYKLLVYLYENRDMYPVNMPMDVQFMINKYRRSIP